MDLLKGDLKTEIANVCSIEEFKDGAYFYIKNMSKGKILIKPSVAPGKFPKQEKPKVLDEE